nr:MAG: hypothetical protein [Skomarfal virus 1]
MSYKAISSKRSFGISNVRIFEHASGNEELAVGEKQALGEESLKPLAGTPLQGVPVAESVLHKEYRLERALLPVNTAANTNVISKQLPFNLVNNPKFPMYKMWELFMYHKGSVRIRFVINSVPTASGIVALVAMPMYSRRDEIPAHIVNSDYFYRYKSFPHIELNVNSQSSGEMLLPWESNRRMTDLDNGSLMQWQLYVYAVTDIACSTATTNFTYNVYASLAEWSYHTPMPDWSNRDDQPSRGVRQLNPYEIRNVRLREQGADQSTTKTSTKQNYTIKMGRESHLALDNNTAPGGKKTMADSIMSGLPGAGDLLGSLGGLFEGGIPFDQPYQVEPCNLDLGRMRGVMSRMHVLGYEPYEYKAVDPSVHGLKPWDGDMHALSSLDHEIVFTGKVSGTIAASTTPFCFIPVYPLARAMTLDKTVPTKYTGIVSHTWASFFTSHFDRWRGGLEYKIRICPTQYHSGQIRVTWVPPGYLPNAITDDTFGHLRHVIVSLGRESVVTVKMPHIGQYEWKYTIKNQLHPRVVTEFVKDEMQRWMYDNVSSGFIVITPESPILFGMQNTAVIPDIPYMITQKACPNIDWDMPNPIAEMYKETVPEKYEVQYEDLRTRAKSVTDQVDGVEFEAYSSEDDQSCSYRQYTDDVECTDFYECTGRVDILPVEEVSLDIPDSETVQTFSRSGKKWNFYELSRRGESILNDAKAPVWSKPFDKDDYLQQAMHFHPGITGVIPLRNQICAYQSGGYVYTLVMGYSYAARGHITVEHKWQKGVKAADITQYVVLDADTVKGDPYSEGGRFVQSAMHEVSKGLTFRVIDTKSEPFRSTKFWDDSRTGLELGEVDVDICPGSKNVGSTEKRLQGEERQAVMMQLYQRTGEEFQLYRPLYPIRFKFSYTPAARPVARGMTYNQVRTMLNRGGVERNPGPRMEAPSVDAEVTEAVLAQLKKEDMKPDEHGALMKTAMAVVAGLLGIGIVKFQKYMNEKGLRALASMAVCYIAQKRRRWYVPAFVQRYGETRAVEELTAQMKKALELAGAIAGLMMLVGKFSSYVCGYRCFAEVVADACMYLSPFMEYVEKYLFKLGQGRVGRVWRELNVVYDEDDDIEEHTGREPIKAPVAFAGSVVSMMVLTLLGGLTSVNMSDQKKHPIVANVISSVSRSAGSDVYRNLRDVVTNTTAIFFAGGNPEMKAAAAKWFDQNRDYLTLIQREFLHRSAKRGFIVDNLGKIDALAAEYQSVNNADFIRLAVNVVSEMRVQLVHFHNVSWQKFADTVTEAHEPLQAIQAFKSFRSEPVGIYLYGKPGVGKSYMQGKFLPPAVLRASGLAQTNFESHVYSIPCDPQQQYWDGYYGQSFVLYDDFGTSAEGAEYVKVMNLISSTSCPINMADLADKGRYFTSSFVCVSSNFSNMMNVKSIRNPEAFPRRFGGLTFEVLCNDDYKDVEGKADINKIEVDMRASPQGVKFLDEVWTFRPFDLADGTTRDRGGDLTFSEVVEKIVKKYQHRTATISLPDLDWSVYAPMRKESLYTWWHGLTPAFHDRYNELVEMMLAQQKWGGDELYHVICGTYPSKKAWINYIQVIGHEPTRSPLDLEAQLRKTAGLDDPIKRDVLWGMYFHEINKKRPCLSERVDQDFKWKCGMSDVCGTCLPFPDEFKTIPDYVDIRALRYLYSMSGTGYKCPPVETQWRGALLDTRYPQEKRDIWWKLLVGGTAIMSVAVVITLVYEVVVLIIAIIWAIMCKMYKPKLVQHMGYGGDIKPTKSVPERSISAIKIAAQTGYDGVIGKIERNIRSVCIVKMNEVEKTHVQWCTFIDDHHFLVNAHFIQKIKKEGHMAIFVDAVDKEGTHLFYIRVPIANFQLVGSPMNGQIADVCVAAMSRVMPFIRKIEKHIITQAEAVSMLHAKSGTVTVMIPKKKFEIEVSGPASWEEWKGAKVPMYWTGHNASTYGDCGSPAVMNQKLIGIHAFASEGILDKKTVHGVGAAWLTKEKYQMAKTLLSHFVKTMEHVEEVPLDVKIVEHTAPPGWRDHSYLPIGKVEMNGHPVKNDLNSVTAFTETEIKVEEDGFLPALQSYRVLYNRCQKYGFPAVMVDPSAQTENVVLEDWAKMIGSIVYEDRSPLSMDEILNGTRDGLVQPIQRDASSGFWKVISEGKKAFIDVDTDVEGRRHYSLSKASEEVKHPWLGVTLLEALAQAEELIAKGKTFPDMWMSSLKDELRPIQKVKEGKTRVFEVPSIVYTILVKKYFGRFGAAYRGNPGFTLCHGIGNDKEAVWTSYAEELALCGIDTRGFDVDYSEFDGSVPPHAFEVFAAVTDMFYGEAYKQQRHVLIHMLQHSYQVVGYYLVQSFKGNKSGNWLTDVFNSVVNVHYLMVSWYALYKNRYGSISPGMFHKVVRMLTYGDDVIITSLPQVLAWFNRASVFAVLECFGFKPTAADKTEEVRETDSLWDLTFLKSKFVIDPKAHLVFAPSDKAVIYRETNWVKKKWKDDPIIRRQMLLSMFRFAAHHGKDFHDAYLNAVREAAEEAGVSQYVRDLPSYEFHVADIAQKTVEFQRDAKITFKSMIECSGRTSVEGHWNPEDDQEPLYPGVHQIEAITVAYQSEDLNTFGYGINWVLQAMAARAERLRKREEVIDTAFLGNLFAETPQGFFFKFKERAGGTHLEYRLEQGLGYGALGSMPLPAPFTNGFMEMCMCDDFCLQVVSNGLHLRVEPLEDQEPEEYINRGVYWQADQEQFEDTQIVCQLGMSAYDCVMGAYNCEHSEAVKWYIQCLEGVSKKHALRVERRQNMIDVCDLKKIFSLNKTTRLGIRFNDEWHQGEVIATTNGTYEEMEDNPRRAVKRLEDLSIVNAVKTGRERAEGGDIEYMRYIDTIYGGAADFNFVTEREFRQHVDNQGRLWFTQSEHGGPVTFPSGLGAWLAEGVGVRIEDNVLLAPHHWHRWLRDQGFRADIHQVHFRNMIWEFDVVCTQFMRAEFHEDWNQECVQALIQHDWFLREFSYYFMTHFQQTGTTLSVGQQMLLKEKILERRMVRLTDWIEITEDGNTRCSVM